MNICTQAVQVGMERILLETGLISFAESLITFPEVQTQADIPPDVRSRPGINNVLLRLSVGIEDVDDLINDMASLLNFEARIQS